MYLIMRMRKGKLVINTVEKHSRMFKFSKEQTLEKANESTICNINHDNHPKEKQKQQNEKLLMILIPNTVKGMN